MSEDKKEVSKESILEAIRAMEKTSADTFIVSTMIGLLPKVIGNKSMFSLEEMFKSKFTVENAIEMLEKSIKNLKEAKAYYDGLV